MYKVLIVDDEPIIVEGLCSSICWAEFGCEVIATTYSGLEALELLRSIKPNIIISDISMPGMDGLEMIQSIREVCENVQITILTGYRDFDYAQRAIRLGVNRFLLKPSKMIELEEAVQSMVNNLRENNILPDGAQDPDVEIEADSSHGTSNSFIVMNAMTYIEENYYKKLKLSDVADEVYVSQWHLSKLLNRHMNKNFSEILNGIRIEHAKELLKDPSLRIGDIADEVGFLDMAHFSRVFKKQMEISANEYRNTVLGKNK